MAFEQEESMPSRPLAFAQVIQEHLELKRRNAALEHEMPLERYMPDDPFENHPLFKTEEQARVEDTMDGVSPSWTSRRPLDWPDVRGHVHRCTRRATPRPGGSRRRTVVRGCLGREPLVADSRDFDWGD